MADSAVDPAVQATATNILNMAAVAGHESRMRRFDQLAEDSASMWAVALTSPTVLAGMGYQAAAGHMPPRQTELSVPPAKPG